MSTWEKTDYYDRRLEKNRHRNSLSTSLFYSALGKRTEDVFPDNLIGKRCANIYTIFATMQVIKDRL
jgi:hypothetical protein